MPQFSFTVGLFDVVPGLGNMVLIVVELNLDINENLPNYMFGFQNLP